MRRTTALVFTVLTALSASYLETMEKTGVLGELRKRWLEGGDWIHDLP
jgi:hypothetical protein